MKRIYKCVIGLTILAGLLAANGTRQQFRSDEITSGEVIGHLDKPLGTICRIEGDVRDAHTAGVSKGDYGHPIHWLELQVSKLNGKLLDRPINFRVDGISGLTTQPKAGDHVSYLVYEDASFFGPKNDPYHLVFQENPAEMPVQTNDPTINRFCMHLRLNVATTQK
jgi:hypothetical protein